MNVRLYSGPHVREDHWDGRTSHDRLRRPIIRTRGPGDSGPPHFGWPHRSHRPVLARAAEWSPHEIQDGSGCVVTPGLIDAHVHLSGGGEAGPETRVPPLAFSELTRYGVTSCVGVLGTDGTTRTMRPRCSDHGSEADWHVGVLLHRKLPYPVPTLTGCIRDDIVRGPDRWGRGVSDQ